MVQLRPFALERFFAQYEFTTRYLLCSSDPQTMRLADLLALESGAEERFTTLTLGYVDSRGTPELRSAIAALYTTIREEQVLVHAGAQEPIFTFMNAAMSAGDHVVV